MASHTSCRKVLGGLGGITLDPNVFRRSSRSTGEPDIPVIQTVQSNMATVNTLILNSRLEWSHFLSWYFTRSSFSKVKHILDTSIVDYIQITCTWHILLQCFILYSADKEEHRCCLFSKYLMLHLKLKLNYIKKLYNFLTHQNQFTWF